MKIYKIGWYHHKNEEFLNNYVKNNHILVNDINDADIILSGNTYIPIEKYPRKKFIFGPHFSVFPNNIVKKINNINNNGIYIQPSQQSVDTWQKEFKYNNLPMKAIPFGVNTDKFSPINVKKDNNIFIYFKKRKQAELNYILNFIKDKNYNIKIFNYNQKYDENTYLNYIRTCKFGIWLGRHESQGFALEEALSCDIPLLVWNVKLRIQEVGMENVYKNIKSPVTTIPYWDERCGKYFYNEDEFIDTYNKFIDNISNYKPREYIIENVSIEACSKKWNELLKFIK